MATLVLEQHPIFAGGNFFAVQMVPTEANDGTMWTDGNLETYAQLTAPESGGSGVGEAYCKAATITPGEVFLRMVVSYELLPVTQNPGLQRFVWNVFSFAEDWWQIGGSLIMSSPGPIEAVQSLANVDDPYYYADGAMAGGWDAERFAADLAADQVFIQAFNNGTPGRSVMRVSQLALELDAPDPVIAGRPDRVRRAFT